MIVAVTSEAFKNNLT
jgi:hypothetical protein